MRQPQVRDDVGMTMFRLKARRCQFCCNVVAKWDAFRGVLNCEDCVHRMVMGHPPRHRCGDKCCGDHGQEIAV